VNMPQSRRHLGNSSAISRKLPTNACRFPIDAALSPGTDDSSVAAI
jgi:hypothetical protein